MEVEHGQYRPERSLTLIFPLYFAEASRNELY